MRALEALLVPALLAAWIAGFVLILRNIRRRKPSWRVGVRGRSRLERPGERPVTFRELPPAIDAIDFAASLRLAVEEAEAQAAELNRRWTTRPARRSPRRAPPPSRARAAGCGGRRGEVRERR